MPFLMRCLVLLLAATVALPASGAVAGQTPATDPPPAFFFQAKDSGTSWFDLEVEPGATVEATALIGVDGDAPLAARTFVADAFTLANGGLGARNEGEELTGPSRWLTYPATELSLQPGELTELDLAVTVPDGTAPGQYLTSVVVQTAESVAVAGSDMLRQTIRKALAVLITVPGPVEPGFAIGEPSLRQLETTDTLVIGIENTGNVLVKPSGHVVVRDSAGAEVLNAPVAMGSVYAGSATTLEVQVPVPLPTGTYSVEVTLADEATGATASAPDLVLDVTSLAESRQPITVDAFTVATVTDTAGAMQLANVTVGLGNTGAPVPSVKITMRVARDGTLVEDYVLNPSLALPSGPSTFEQRYIPVSGWTPGVYTFTLIVEAVDLGTGQVTTVQTVDAADAITVD